MFPIEGRVLAKIEETYLILKYARTLSHTFRFSQRSPWFLVPVTGLDHSGFWGEGLLFRGGIKGWGGRPFSGDRVRGIYFAYGKKTQMKASLCTLGAQKAKQLLKRAFWVSLERFFQLFLPTQGNFFCNFS
jgi:hypothetical protein